MGGIVLVDTSIFVDFLRPGDFAEEHLFAELIQEDRVVYCGMIEAELRYGLKPGEERKVLGLLDGFHFLKTDDGDFVEGGRIGNALRRQGITVPLHDCIIAAVARRNDVPLLTSDRHYEVIPGIALLSDESHRV
jgi:predicted nucleic acid-binding protein